MRRFSVLLVTMFFALAAPIAAPAQDSPVSSEAAAPTAPAAADAPAAGVQGPAFAERAQQARTMEAYWHVFIAFAVTLFLLFGYAISLGRRWAVLEREVLVMRRETGPA